MRYMIKSVKARTDYALHVTFMDGTIKYYSVKALINSDPAMEPLKDEELFAKVKLDEDGYGVSWSDTQKIDSDTIWKGGSVR